MMEVQEIVRQMRRLRLPVTTEEALQRALWDWLIASGLPVEREARLGPADRIDFLVDDDIGIEAKTRCSRRGIFRQLERYATNHPLNGLILVTGTYMGLPEEIAGTPVFLVSTGRGAL
jgi:hypothetical protein